MTPASRNSRTIAMLLCPEARRPAPELKFVRGAAKLLSASSDLDFQAVASHESGEQGLSKTRLRQMRQPKPAPSIAYRTYRKSGPDPYFQIRILDIAIA